LVLARRAMTIRYAITCIRTKAAVQIFSEVDTVATEKENQVPLSIVERAKHNTTKSNR
jgi:hypothetical protein